MVTGCAPFFLLALVGVAFGSWIFGSHLAARLMGLGALTLFMLYFALLNWTAQARARQREAELSAGEAPPAGAPRPEAMTPEARAEWRQFLRSEGQMLWFGVGVLLLVMAVLIWRGR